MPLATRRLSTNAPNVIMEEEPNACRLCSSPSQLVDVGDEATPYAAEYRNIVKLTTSIKVLPKDALSSWICRSCLKLAIKNYDYCRLAHQRNRELAHRKRLRATTDKSRSHSDSDDDVQLVSISFDITAERKHSHLTQSPAVQVVESHADEALENKQVTDSMTMHASVKKILKLYPDLRLPSTALTMNYDARVVKLNQDAVRQHIVKLNRQSRRGRGRDREQRRSGEAHVRLDVPEMMPTTARELKALVTSSLGLRRTGPETPPTTTTPPPPPSDTYDSPVSSFHFPNETPRKSILYPASEGARLSHPLAIDVPTGTAHGFASPIDVEYAVHPMDLVETEMHEADDDDQMDYSLIKIAGEEVIFICDYCHKVFQTKSGYATHQRVHRRCGACRLTFRRASLLREHLERRCPARARDVRVRLRRMETDATVRRLLPATFLAQVADIGNADDVQKKEEEEEDEEDVIDVEEIILSDVEEAPLAPEDSVFSQVTKYYAHDNDAELSEVESMHLVNEEDEEELLTDALVAPALTSSTLSSSSSLSDSEASHVRRLMATPRRTTLDAHVQVTPKDFVSIETRDATLCVRHLGRVLARDEVVPVTLLYQRHKVKLRIVDYRPPTFERKLYDFSRATPVSMANCRGSANRFGYMSTLSSPPPPPPPTTTTTACETKAGGERIRVSSSLFATKSKAESARTEYDALYAGYMARILRTIDEVVSTSATANTTAEGQTKVASSPIVIVDDVAETAPGVRGGETKVAPLAVASTSEAPAASNLLRYALTPSSSSRVVLRRDLFAEEASLPMGNWRAAPRLVQKVAPSLKVLTPQDINNKKGALAALPPPPPPPLSSSSSSSEPMKDPINLNFTPVPDLFSSEREQRQRRNERRRAKRKWQREQEAKRRKLPLPPPPPLPTHVPPVGGYAPHPPTLLNRFLPVPTGAAPPMHGVGFIAIDEM